MSGKVRRYAEQTDFAWPRCIYLAGADGAGKTTQAGILKSLLEQQGINSRYVWLRFPRLFCSPFLVYARKRGYSYQERINGSLHGYWDFQDSWLMSSIFPWVLWLDTFLLAILKIYLPLVLGYALICDRFVVDILVDLMTGLSDPCFDERLLGRLFFALLPRGTKVAILDLDTITAKKRSPEIQGDRTHSTRRALYMELAGRNNISAIASDNSIETTTSRLLEVITSGAEKKILR